MPHGDPGDLGLRLRSPGFWIGFLSVALQVYLLREFAAHFFGNELVIGLALGSWLLAGGWGSLRASRRRRAGNAADAITRAILLAPAALAGLRLSRYAFGLAAGEVAGPGLALAAALAVGMAMSYPLGAAFAAAAAEAGSTVRVYISEAAGAATGGWLVSFGLVPLLSNWQGAALAAAIAAAALAARRSPRPRRSVVAVSCAVVLAAFVALDRPLAALAWRPFDLLESRDGLYGKLQAVRRESQISLYENGLLAATFSDRAGAEDAVHFALLQRPDPKRVLLIGGGPGGGLAEALKYPVSSLEDVELDPGMIALWRRLAPPEEGRPWDDPRVRIRAADGRAYLRSSTGALDAILVDLPPPSTAQVNRYFSLEFFRLAKARLTPGGVLSLRVPAAETYVSQDLADFLASLRATLRAVFEEIALVPGESAVFLASDGPLTLSAEYLAEALARAGVRTAFLTRRSLASRLQPLRAGALKNALDRGRSRTNLDLEPISYFFHSVLWSAQFRGPEATSLRALARVPIRRILDAAILLWLATLAALALKRRGAAPALAAMAALGLTGMSVEILIFLWYQARFGALYSGIPLLLASFMAGLFAGAVGLAKRTAPRFAHLVALQCGIVVFVSVLRLSLGADPPRLAFVAALFVLGGLSGGFFVAANRLRLPDPAGAGLAYGWDLLGSFAAAVAVSAVLIPLAGLVRIIDVLVVANSALLLFLLAGPGLLSRRR